jgi:hypothetical protein
LSVSPATGSHPWANDVHRPSLSAASGKGQGQQAHCLWESAKPSWRFLNLKFKFPISIIEKQQFIFELVMAAALQMAPEVATWLQFVILEKAGRLPGNIPVAA